MAVYGLAIPNHWGSYWILVHRHPPQLPFSVAYSPYYPNQNERTIWPARFISPYTSKCGQSLNPGQSPPQRTRASASFISRANLLSSPDYPIHPSFIYSSQ